MSLNIQTLVKINRCDRPPVHTANISQSCSQNSHESWKFKGVILVIECKCGTVTVVLHGRRVEVKPMWSLNKHE